MQRGLDMNKMNCWEHKKCGREVGGAKSAELGVCPAALEERLNGLHGGKNGGRACWVIAGTLCGGQVQGVFAQKWRNCFECDFFKRLKSEEGDRIKEASAIMAKLENR